MCFNETSHNSNRDISYYKSSNNSLICKFFSGNNDIFLHSYRIISWDIWINCVIQCIKKRLQGLRRGYATGSNGWRAGGGDGGVRGAGRCAIDWKGRGRRGQRGRWRGAREMGRGARLTGRGAIDWEGRAIDWE